MPTLQELSIQYAKKQPKMVDNITEEAPILARIDFEAASHGLWNMYEEIGEVVGGAFVALDAPLPNVGVTTELKKLDLAIMGGKMLVGEDTAQMMGGPAKYFAKRQPIVLRETGVAAEKAILYNNFRQYAIDHGRLLDATATGNVNYCLLAVRFVTGETCGLYSPEGFKQGALMDVKAINNGGIYEIDPENKPGVLGYGVRMKGYFGIQIAGHHTVAAIVNITSAKVPTAAQIDDLLDMVRATPGSTMLMCHRKVLTFLNTHKGTQLRMGVEDKNMDRRINSWDGIPFITSYNFQDGTETKVTVSA